MGNWHPRPSGVTRTQRTAMATEVDAAFSKAFGRVAPEAAPEGGAANDKSANNNNNSNNNNNNNNNGQTPQPSSAMDNRCN